MGTYTKKNSVVPAFISSGVIPVKFADCLQISAGKNRNQTPWISAASARLNTARTTIGEAFLKGTAEWIWYLDDDMVFGPEVLPQLLRTAKEKNAKVVGGLCFIFERKSGRIYPNAFSLAQDRQKGDHKYRKMATYPEEPFTVDATGGACLLVHRQVMEDIAEKYRDHPYPWQDERPDEISGAMIGEDFTFCEKAIECGYDVWYDPRAKVKHTKEIDIGHVEHRAYMLSLSKEYLERQTVVDFDATGTDIH